MATQISRLLGVVGIQNLPQPPPHKKARALKEQEEKQLGNMRLYYQLRPLSKTSTQKIAMNRVF